MNDIADHSLPVEIAVAINMGDEDAIEFALELGYDVEQRSWDTTGLPTDDGCSRAVPEHPEMRMTGHEVDALAEALRVHAPRPITLKISVKR